MNTATFITRPVKTHASVLVTEVILDTEQAKYANRFDINPSAGWLLHILPDGFFMGPMGGFEIVGDIEVQENAVKIGMNDADFEHFEFLLMQNPLAQ